MSKPLSPYLLRAYYDWIVDNGMTPYTIIDMRNLKLDVPLSLIINNQLVLNISKNACANISLGKEFLEANMSFNSLPSSLKIPIQNVLGIYSRETGVGVLFDGVEIEDNVPDNIPPPSTGKPTLKVVK